MFKRCTDTLIASSLLSLLLYVCAAQAADVSDLQWSPLTVMSLQNVQHHGAVPNDRIDDTGALRAAIAALPTSGGIVYLPPGEYDKRAQLLYVDKSHVKFWSPNRQARLHQSIDDTERKQAIVCRRNSGCGFFGLHFTSDAARRFDALEDNQIAADHGSLIEVIGNDIEGSAGTAVFLYGSTEHYVAGNRVRDTWADHIHHTAGASASWVWGNFISNDPNIERGDDGIACVTYGPSSTRCRDMEWWSNKIVGTGWGRGYAVIGGNDINIHDNWAVRVAGAGVIVASEPRSSFGTSASQRITIDRNYVYRSAHVIGHPGILISGDNPEAGPITDVVLRNNVSVETVLGEPYRAEGNYRNVMNSGLATTVDALPHAVPTLADAHIADTTVLKTRDTSHVATAYRKGLLRIHVRQAPDGTGFQQRFEYVIKGSVAEMDRFIARRRAANDAIVEQRYLSGANYVLLFSARPIAVPSGLAGVSFRELRSGDRSGSLRSIWRRIDGAG